MLAAMLFACGGGNQTEEKAGETAKTTTPDPEAKKREAKGFHAYDKDFQVVAASYDGVIRGVDMYATPEEVKAVEAAKKEVEFQGNKMEMAAASLVEEKDDMLKYTLKMAEMEDAVIEYHFADGKLNAIKILVHVGTNVQFEAMEEEFIQYFTHKHGAPTSVSGKKDVWKVKGSDTHEIDILDKQKDDQFYLEVDIS